MSVLFTRRGAPPAPFRSSWSVESISGAAYGFTQIEGGYYESNNKGYHSTAALCRVIVSATKPFVVTVSYVNYAEQVFDYGLLGSPDTAQSTSYNESSTGVELNLSSYNSSSVQTYTYQTLSEGDHFIDMKFRKDGSVNSGNDSLQFTITITEAES